MFLGLIKLFQLSKTVGITMEFTQSIINLLINCIMIICTKYYVDVNYGVEE